VSWSAEYLVLPVRRWIDHEPWIPYAATELAHRDLSLQPREWSAETEVDAAAVAKVLFVLTFEIDLVRVRERVRVAVSGGVQRDDRRAFLNRCSRNLDVFEGGARVGQNWTDDSNHRTPGTINSGQLRNFSRASPCRSREHMASVARPKNEVSYGARRLRLRRNRCGDLFT
jgi:hypothetical protein